MLKIFLSYASEDRDKVIPFFERLKSEGFLPWMDKLILPGQNWEFEITRNFKAANVVIIFLSRNSVTKRGYVRREAHDAVEQLKYKLEDDIYIIPVLLEPCDVPDKFKERMQHIEIDEQDAWNKIIASLRLAAQQQRIELAEGVTHGPFKVFSHKIEEAWEGKPGHNIDIAYPRFESTSHGAAANELSQLFAGRAAATLIKSRQPAWQQTPDLFADREGFSASNGRWDAFDIVFANDDILSLNYHVGWYGAGAAHPNSHYETHNFYLREVVTPIELYSLFSDPAEALKRISETCLRELCRELWERTGKSADADDLEWFKGGAGPEWDNFSMWTVSRDGFTFLFPPYQVHCYALGPWTADVSFYDLLDFLPKDGIQTKVGRDAPKHDAATAN